MQDERKFIPYAVQKGNRPKIDAVINNCLDGDLQRSALDFAAYMRDNNMPFRLFTSTTRSQRANYKNQVICMINIYAEEDWNHVDIAREGDPQHWSIAPHLLNMDKYLDAIKNEQLQIDFNGRIWWCKHGIHGYERTGGCAPDKSCAGGKDMTVFGDKFAGVCRWSWLPAKNPDAATINKIKKLLELEQQARDAV